MADTGDKKKKGGKKKGGGAGESGIGFGTCAGGTGPAAGTCGPEHLRHPRRARRQAHGVPCEVSWDLAPASWSDVYTQPLGRRVRPRALD